MSENLMNPCLIRVSGVRSLSYEFPKNIQQTIYTSNLIENNNKGFRHKAKLKEQFPNEDSLERFAYMVY